MVPPDCRYSASETILSRSSGMKNGGPFRASILGFTLWPAILATNPASTLAGRSMPLLPLVRKITARAIVFFLTSGRRGMLRPANVLAGFVARIAGHRVKPRMEARNGPPFFIPEERESMVSLAL